MEILIIVLIILLLFGATRLPNAARSLGRSMRIFKSEMDEMKSDKKPADQQAIEHQDPVQNQVQNFGQQPAQQPHAQPQQPVRDYGQAQPVQQPQQPGTNNGPVQQ